jgi:hypothetical protein
LGSIHPPSQPGFIRCEDKSRERERWEIAAVILAAIRTGSPASSPEY